MTPGCHWTPLTSAKAWLYLTLIQLLVIRLALTDSTLLLRFSTLRFRAGNLGHYPVIGITSPASSPLNESKIVVLPLAHNHCQHCEAIRPLDEGNSI